MVKRDNKKLLIIIPAYNEADNLKILLPQLHDIMKSVCDEYEIIVVDSQKTTDDTPLVCDDLSATYVIQQGAGYGSAFRTGISCAKGDALLVVDADNSQSAQDMQAAQRRTRLFLC